MSQMVTRKGVVSEEKRQSDSPVKDMKKKMAANAEKEKQSTDKLPEKPKQTEKAPEKPKQAEKAPEKPKQAEKAPEKPKQAEKAPEKPKQAEKAPEKPKQAEKAPERPKQTEKAPEKPKQTEKVPEKPKPVEKAPEKQKQVEKTPEKPKQAEKVPEKPKVAEKSSEKPVEKNGVDNKKTDSKEKKEDKVERNGKPHEKKNGDAKQNGRHNGDSNGVDDMVSEEDGLEGDDEFPELAYDESDSEEPERTPSRSLTRRSQVKATRTPETPLPATERANDDEPKDKVLKLKDDASSDRKLRSADSPKPESNQNGGKDAEVIDLDADEEPRKTDTNYSKSRVKVSPYRRSMRLADQTTSSVMANYTGNNTTMEMDITETSFAEEPSLNDSSYLNGLRSIKGRRSYKLLKEITLKHVTANRSAAASTDSATRPTGTVVGRKRKPEAEEAIEVATEAEETHTAQGKRMRVDEPVLTGHGKRMRLLDRILPFRRTVEVPVMRRNPEIVGINTDLPLTAPVAPETFDPETLKTPPSDEPPVVPPVQTDRDGKRCVVM